MAETDNTVSAPNHVAKTQAKFMYSGSERPATMKSVEFFTRVEAQIPIATVAARYTNTQAISIVHSQRNSFSWMEKLGGMLYLARVRMAHFTLTRSVSEDVLCILAYASG